MMAVGAVLNGLVGFAALIYVLAVAPGWGKALALMIACGFWLLHNRAR